MVLIRVEDREQFGQGNRSRAIAIAQSLQRVGEKYCITASSSKWYEYLKLNNFSTVLIENNYDISLEVNTIKDSFTDSKIYFIILDGDRFGSKYINLLKMNQIKSVIIDDVAPFTVLLHNTVPATLVGTVIPLDNTTALGLYEFVRFRYK